MYQVQYETQGESIFKIGTYNKKEDAIKYAKKRWHELFKERERIAGKQSVFAVSDQNNYLISSHDLIEGFQIIKK